MILLIMTARLTSEQQNVLHENTRIVHDTNLYSAWIHVLSKSVRTATLVINSGYYETDSERIAEWKELGARQSRMPYAEAPFLFRGGCTKVGTFVLSLCKVQPQDGLEVEGSDVIMGSKPIPGAPGEDGAESEGFLYSEFGEDSLDLALARLRTQLAVGLPGTKEDNLAVLDRLQNKPGLGNTDIL